jgi:hypothetical protein
MRNEQGSRHHTGREVGSCVHYRRSCVVLEMFLNTDTATVETVKAHFPASRPLSLSPLPPPPPPPSPPTLLSCQKNQNLILFNQDLKLKNGML